jgi:hypothetical protein
MTDRPSVATVIDAQSHFGRVEHQLGSGRTDSKAP